MRLSDFVPIMASLRRHKLTALLLALQVTFTCSIVCNILFLVVQRVNVVASPTGLDESRLSVIETQSVATGVNWPARHQEMLNVLGTIPGVTSVAAIDTLPLGGSESSYGICASLDYFTRAIQSHSLVGPGCVQAAVLGGTRGELDTLGLKLVMGRDFLPEEYVLENVPSAIISRALAERLFPGEGALGKTIYSGAGPDHPIRIVGVVEHLMRPKLQDHAANELSMLWPILPNESDVTYVLRSTPTDRDRVLRLASERMMNHGTDLIVPPEKSRTYSSLRSDYFRRDLTMISLLVSAIAALLFVTGVGIAGLAKFWVQQRTRQIGIRRALGATRLDILGYFHAENVLIIGIGIMLGFPLAYLLNSLLMSAYDVPRLSGAYLPIGAIALLLLGQFAVLGPALKAASVSPNEAVRNRS